jgi:hypothetical protein
MFPLQRRNLPASPNELARIIEAELRSFVHKPGSIVDVCARAFPYIDKIAIKLDGAQIEQPVAPRLAAGNSTKPAFEVSLVDVSGRNVRLRGTEVDLRVKARGVCFHEAVDAKGNVTLLLHRIEEGEMSVWAAQTELEEAIARLAADQARPHGITIEQVKLALRARGPRSVGAEVRIQARKFVRVHIAIYGQLDIDDDFVARISQLRCESAGVVASRVCHMLEPHLARFNGRSFSLKSLPFGENQLRDLRIVVTATGVELCVGFGSGPAQT